MNFATKKILLVILGLLLGILITFPVTHLDSHDCCDTDECVVCILQTNLATGFLLFVLALFLFTPPRLITFLFPQEVPLSPPFSGFQFFNKAPPIV